MRNLKGVLAVTALFSVIVCLGGCCGGVCPAGKAACGVCPLSRPDDAMVLFDGTDFSKWVGEEGAPVKWQIIDGAMKVVPGSGSIVTKETFEDFRLHVEFNIPESPPDATGQERGNSGVYIQRRYEIQILDSHGLAPGDGECGAIYKTKPPDKNMAKSPGQWQSYDIIFCAARFEGEQKVADARITVLWNNAVVHNNVLIPDKTGAGQPEGPRPGPIKLQDHGSPLSFRNIWIVRL